MRLRVHSSKEKNAVKYFGIKAFAYSLAMTKFLDPQHQKQEKKQKKTFVCDTWRIFACSWER